MSFHTKRLAVAAAITTIGALAIPAASGAAVTPVVDGTTLTVTSNQDADTIAIATAGGVLTVNGTATGLAANEQAVIRVNAGDGNDTVDASALTAANYNSLDVSGGNGDDLVTGGADTDIIAGDAGDDRLLGFRGGDEVAGGDGNDTMVWNNGDGTDSNDGDGGNDEVVVNGAPTQNDMLTAAPGAEPGRVLFQRTNLGTFSIDLSAERLTVNGLGGNDQFGNDGIVPPGLAGRTSLTLNGDSGVDFLIGGDGADVVNGGEGNDALFGGPGDDRLTGDRGTDSHDGEAGDDTAVWNNGDGSDQVVGDAGFDTAEVNGSPSAATGDDFRIEPNGENAVFSRANLVPFTIGLSADTEAVAVNGGTGNDELFVFPGLARMFVVADGGSGNDILTGAEEADTFLGGSGADFISPGAGSDLADGGTDDDEVLARDDTGDLVRGGPGADFAETDSIHVDQTTEVERHDATPLPEPPAPDAKALLPEVGEPTVARKGRRLSARVPLTCPAAEAGGCDVTLTLETARAIRVGPVRAPLVLGTGTADLQPGQAITVKVPLARGAAGLAKGGKLAARLRVFSADAAGNLVAGKAVVDLRIPKR
jgi:Ca2+-binding RTX toxin-like protein